MKHSNIALNSALVCLALLASTGTALAQGNSSRAQTMAVAYPWVFKKGHDDAKTTTVATAAQIARRAGFASISGDVARDAWGKRPVPSFGKLPTRATLRSYGRSLKAGRILYGSVAWHTRSIWVNLGPKTISTATVNVYVFDVNAGRVVYKRTQVKGRSDEKSNGLKIAGAILLTPLVTAVSGGPATPQEQRAAQIALGKAYSDWVTKANQ